jgi:hypothetical protein
MVMYTRPVPDGGIWVRFDKSNQANALAAFEKIYKEAMPGSVFKYQFLDELNASRTNKSCAGKVANIATISIVPDLLPGIIWLVIMLQRGEQRKWNQKGAGASVQQIVQLISADFLNLSLLRS